MSSAMRSPEMTMPSTIARPNTTYCQAFESPRMRSSWLSRVTKNAAEPRRRGAGQPAREGGAAEHDGGHRSEQVGGTRIDAGADDDRLRRAPATPAAIDAAMYASTT